jgi:hypothetical protein
VVGPVLDTVTGSTDAVVGPVLDTVIGTDTKGSVVGLAPSLVGSVTGGAAAGTTPASGTTTGEAQERPTQSVSAGSGGPPAVQPAQADATTAPGFRAPADGTMAGVPAVATPEPASAPDPALAPTRDTPATVGSRLAAFARSSLVGSSIFAPLAQPSLGGSSIFAALAQRVRDGSPVSPASAPAELPALPSAPSGAASASAPGGASTALYALLLAFAALALLRFDRLQLRPVRWRCAAFVALLERPG